MPPADSTQPVRCPWATGDLLAGYHDTEWGVPVHDDRRHFEFILLEGAQAGLSWVTVLRRREGYRRCFADFDPVAVAAFDAARIDELVRDAGIIRNRAKIVAAVSNARVLLDVAAEHGTFDAYLWGHTGGRVVRRDPADQGWRATSPLSDGIASELRRRGMRFFGSTICYAHLQAVGVVNDHLASCFRYALL